MQIKQTLRGGPKKSLNILQLIIFSSAQQLWGNTKKDMAIFSISLIIWPWIAKFSKLSGFWADSPLDYPWFKH